MLDFKVLCKLPHLHGTPVEITSLHEYGDDNWSAAIALNTSCGAPGLYVPGSEFIKETISTLNIPYTKYQDYPAQIIAYNINSYLIQIRLESDKYRFLLMNIQTEKVFEVSERYRPVQLLENGKLVLESIEGNQECINRILSLDGSIEDITIPGFRFIAEGPLLHRIYETNNSITGKSFYLQTPNKEFNVIDQASEIYGFTNSGFIAGIAQIAMDDYVIESEALWGLNSISPMVLGDNKSDDILTNGLFGGIALEKDNIHFVVGVPLSDNMALYWELNDSMCLTLQSAWHMAGEKLIDRINIDDRINIKSIDHIYGTTPSGKIAVRATSISGAPLSLVLAPV